MTGRLKRLRPFLAVFRFLSIAGLAGLLAPAASARVGETEQELIARHGPVTSRQPARKSSQGKMYIIGERLTFRSEDWGVSTLIIRGRCEEINYTKQGEWTEVQFSYLLEVNGGRAQWTEEKTRNPKVRRDWIRRRDQTTAGWGLSGFMVRTPAVEQALTVAASP